MEIDYLQASERAESLQKIDINNFADESDILEDFTKEVESPFLKENRRKKVKPEQSKNNDEDEEGEYSFSDLTSEDEPDEEEADEQTKEFNKDIVTFIVNGLDFAIDKGGELVGYEAEPTSPHIEAQKDNLIKYGTIVFEKYNFKLKPEHMLLVALVFYIKAKAGQLHKKDEKETVSLEKSKQELKKPKGKSEKTEGEQLKSEIEKVKSEKSKVKSEKSKVRQSLL